MRELLRPWPLAAIVAAFALGWGVWLLSGTTACGTYDYVNADVACGDQGISKAGYVTLRNDVSRYIDEATSTGRASEVSVYYRDLRDGPSFGIGANNAFAPASLLKLPIIISFFSLNADEPGVLEKKLRYDPAALDNQFDIARQINFDFEGETLKSGQDYTVRQLMEASIVYSDNYAYFTLLKYINLERPGGTAFVLETMQELGVIDPRSPEEETVSVRNYSGIFRILYNAAFLDADNSERVLHWLVEATFKEGLIAGVPASTPVATKFGERTLDGEAKQLHDCGIVYHPRKPYTLCVMTQGSDWAELKKVISDISTMVYKEVDSRER